MTGAVFEQAKAHFLKSLEYVEAQAWAKAEAELRASLRLIPDRVSTLTNLCTVLVKQGKLAEARALNPRILAMEPGNVEALLVEGLLLNDDKAFGKALASYARAIELKPDFALAWANRGDTLRHLARYSEAQMHYEKALAFDATLTAGIRGLMECYRQQGDYPRVFELHGRHRQQIEADYLACELLGDIHLERRDKAGAYEAYERARAVSEKTPSENNHTEWPVLASRLRHDFEQLSYLEEQGLANDACRQALAALKRYYAGAAPAASDGDFNEALLSAVSRYHHVPDLPFDGQALGDNDYPKIEQDFLNGKVRLVIIDNFLTQEALTALRRHCWEATIWKQSFASGYVGTFIGTGFASRVLLSIADELRSAMPNVIGNNALSHAWGFKYDQALTGVNLHADFARINTNFWITPDDACLDPNTGGLLVYDVPAPNDWSFYSYNCDQQRIKDFLAANHSQFVRVPYRANRCVLFDSTYFHATDELHFKPGYTNRRINCTLLFGKAL